MKVGTRFKHLAALERSAIVRLAGEGFTLRAIAAATGRHFSTVSRVVARARGDYPLRQARGFLEQRAL